MTDTERQHAAVQRGTPRREERSRPLHAAVIVGYARTPIGRFQGGLAPLSAVALGGRAIAAALQRAGVPPDHVGTVLMGHVLQAGQGQLTARQAAVRAGLSLDVPAATVNTVCLSGLTAITWAHQQILLGEHQVIVAGGMESMSNAPYVLPHARAGYRLGHGELIDVLLHDGLWCALEDRHMGRASDDVSARLGITRSQQDAWAARSHERAARAWKDGLFSGEVVAVDVPERRGASVSVDTDEGVRPGTTTDTLAGLPPAFSADGTVTAGNASQLSDGAAAVVMTSAAYAREHGLQPLARVLAAGSVAGPDPSLHHQPAAAVRAASARLDRDPAGYDLYELNEAFASVALHAARLLGVDADRVNPNGGAVALGHPIGATGARLVVTLLHALRRRGGGTGAAALCGGGGQGQALIIHAG